MDSINKRKFAKDIVKWYKKQGRSFPWRYNNNAYQVMVSELLLQKTDAPKVEAVFNNFFTQFPSINTIYNSNIKDIQQILKPLGLYRRRAERLKSIADSIINNYSGEVPKNKEGLMALNGVGDYISNAVLCFAYQTPKPIVDTNVIRIFERLFSIKSTKKRPRTDKQLWQFAESLLPKNNVQDYNYGLLDFASAVCKARKPDCGNCIFITNCNFGKNYIND